MLSVGTVFLSFVIAVFSKKTLEIIDGSDIINVSSQCQWMTGNIATIMNDKYFLISYENATGTVENMIDSSMVAEVYDTMGNKINTETIILAKEAPSNIAVFRQQASQCQCNYNQNNDINNNLMYGWIHEADGYTHANASYRILYTSDYNNNNLNMSEWIIADNTNINVEHYSAESGICTCLENGNYVYVWINAYLNPNDTVNEYMIFIDQKGNNINANGEQYIIHSADQMEYIFYLISCITYNCDTFLGIDVNGIGWLYSISSPGKLLKDGFDINQHKKKAEEDDIVSAISLSNGLYSILILDKISKTFDLSLIFLETENATQLSVNSDNNWNEKVNYNNQTFLWINMKEIKDESVGDIVYVVIIYSDAETSIWGSLYQIKRVNDNMVDVLIVGSPFEIYVKPQSNYPIQHIYLASIGKTMMVAWDEDNFMLQARIVTLNITNV